MLSGERALVWSKIQRVEGDERCGQGLGGDGAGRSREPSYSCSKPNGLLMKILVGLNGSLLSKGNWLPPKVVVVVGGRPGKRTKKLFDLCSQ